MKTIPSPQHSRIHLPGITRRSPLCSLQTLGTAALTFLFLQGHAAEPRVFTDKTGRTFKAELLSVKGPSATLKGADGRVYVISISNLCEADHQFLQQQKSLADTAANPAATNQQPVPANSVIIEALIDGPSELRVKKDGIYWINGGNAKPGRHHGQELPTYVDGRAWSPNWKEPRKERGVDRSSTKNVEGISPLEIEFKLLNVTLNRGDLGVEQRDPIRVTMVEDELSILIPDTQGGSMWYRFALVRKPKP